MQPHKSTAQAKSPKKRRASKAISVPPSSLLAFIIRFTRSRASSRRERERGMSSFSLPGPGPRPFPSRSQSAQKRAIQAHVFRHPSRSVLSTDLSPSRGCLPAGCVPNAGERGARIHALLLSYPSVSPFPQFLISFLPLRPFLRSTFQMSPHVDCPALLPSAPSPHPHAYCCIDFIHTNC